MSSAKSLAFEISIVPSKILLLGLVLAHLLAAAALLFSSVPNALAAGLAISLLICLWIYGNPRSRWFIRRVAWQGDRWTLRYGDGRERSARLLAHYRHPQLLILNFAHGRWGRRSLLLLPDSADPDRIRRLRVHLLTLHGDALAPRL